ncbi:conserved hypothetical protein [Ricinus communis]|uniref:Uncharacterized protein n=1 Tax=Ricinus communis TaxID=3988 RepID=B9SUW5_RICCO|nr:conserved hypothetical protein [Ricinus communis]
MSSINQCRLTNNMADTTIQNLTVIAKTSKHARSCLELIKELHKRTCCAVTNEQEVCCTQTTESNKLTTAISDN